MHLIKAVFSFVAVVVLCTLACVSIVRTFGVAIPFAFPFHIGERRERDLITSLHGRSKGTCIFIAGFLLFTFPMLLGLIAYDRLLPIQSSSSSNYYTGTGIVVLILALSGVAFGNRIWKKVQPYFFRRTIWQKILAGRKLLSEGVWLRQIAPVNVDGNEDFTQTPR